jgi:hypothetical protein
MYIIYLDQCKQRPHPTRRPMIHIQFKTALCEALLEGWPRKNEVDNSALTHRLGIHMPSHSTLKRHCVVCKYRMPHTYCYQCRFQFMCWKEGCYEQHHEALARRNV